MGVDLVAGVLSLQPAEEELRWELLLLEGLVALGTEARGAHGLESPDGEEGEGDADADLLDGQVGVELFGVEPEALRNGPAVEATAELGQARIHPGHLALRLLLEAHGHLADAQVQEFVDRYCPEHAATLWGNLHGSPQLDLLRTPYYLRLLGEQTVAGEISVGRGALFGGG